MKYLIFSLSLFFFSCGSGNKKTKGTTTTIENVNSQITEPTIIKIEDFEKSIGQIPANRISKDGSEPVIKNPIPTKPNELDKIEVHYDSWCYKGNNDFFYLKLDVIDEDPDITKYYHANFIPFVHHPLRIIDNPGELTSNKTIGVLEIINRESTSNSGETTRRPKLQFGSILVAIDLPYKGAGKKYDILVTSPHFDDHDGHSNLVDKTHTSRHTVDDPRIDDDDGDGE